MNDKNIRREIEKFLKKIKFENISFRIENKVVYLDGKVSSYNDFLEIGLLIGKVRNIKGVVNNIEYPNKKKIKKEKGATTKIGKVDVVIIGGGVVGSSIARELSKYKLKVILVEK